MKKLILLLLLASLSITATWSQETASGGFRRAGTNLHIKGMHKKQLKDTLGLTTEQANQVDAIQQDFKLKMRAVKLDTKLTDAGKNSRLAILKKERMDKLRGVISKEQIAKLDGTKKHPKKLKKTSYRKTIKKG